MLRQPLKVVNIPSDCENVQFEREKTRLAEGRPPRDLIWVSVCIKGYPDIKYEWRAMRMNHKHTRLIPY